MGRRRLERRAWGQSGSPPPGDGRFNQLDIVAAQIAGLYLTGPYATIKPAGAAQDMQTSAGYNSGTGSVPEPASVVLATVGLLMLTMLRGQPRESKEDRIS